MTDLMTKYPAGTRVRFTAAVEGVLGGATGLTGTVTAWNKPEDDAGVFVRVVLDSDKTTSAHDEVIEAMQEVTGEPGLLFAEEELEVINE